MIRIRQDLLVIEGTQQCHASLDPMIRIRQDLLVIEGTQQCHASLDPVVLVLISRDLNGEDKVRGVTRGRQCTLRQTETVV